MQSMQLTWKRSLATFALLATINSPDLAATAAQLEGRNSPNNLDNPGSPPPAVNAPATEAASPGSANKPRPASNSDAAMDAFRRRYGLGPARATGTAANAKREKVEAKLNEIVLQEVAFDGLPLSEVLKMLSDESIKRDPEKKGINFLINNNAPVAATTAIDPATGLPVTAPAEPFDVGAVLVKFSLPLRNVSLKDTLEAITKVAERPIEYSVEDYGVVISPKPEPMGGKPAATVAGNVPEPWVACTFKVDTNTFLAGLENAFGITVRSGDPGQPGVRARDVQTALKTLLTQLGVNSVDARTIFYNDLTGMVMVRAKPDEQGVIQAAMETLGGTPLGSYNSGGFVGGVIGGGGGLGGPTISGPR